jgi:hypothetical protein
LQQTNGSCRFPFAKFQEHGDLEMKAWKHAEIENGDLVCQTENRSLCHFS